MAERKLNCLRCDAEMNFREKTYLSLSDTGGFGNFGNGYLLVEIYTCPQCGKVELFRAGIGVPKDEPPAQEHYTGPDPSGFYVPGVAEDIKCHQCGRLHPADDPYCPLCGMPTRAPEPRSCPWCGKELFGKPDRCPGCGAAL